MPDINTFNTFTVPGTKNMNKLKKSADTDYEHVNAIRKYRN